MLSENIDRRPNVTPQPAFGLMPCGIVAGATTPAGEGRLIEAQGAMNRFQVWIGDLFIAMTAFRAPHMQAHIRDNEGVQAR